VADPDNRRVEVFFFDGVLGVQPPPPGDNSRPGSAEYPEWVKRAKRTLDHEIAVTLVAKIFFDLPPEQKPVPQSFTLISTDLVFKQTLAASATVRVDEKTAVLVFTGIHRGKVYSLSYDIGDGKQVAIFTGVPLDSLDDFGDDTKAPEALALADPPAPEEPANDGTGDELLALNDADKAFDPNLIEPDPGIVDPDFGTAVI
jgi:hypothetical protein